MLAQAFQHLKDEGRVLRRSPLSFVVSVLLVTSVFGGCIYWFVDHLYASALRGQLAQIQAQEATIKDISEERDHANRDNEKLRRDVAAFQAVHDDKSFPLKKRALILSSQLKEYAARLIDATNKNDPVKRNEINNEWENRFQHRVNLVLSQLDEYGQHSEKLESSVNYVGIYSPQAAELISLYSSEIARMANNLADTP